MARRNWPPSLQAAKTEPGPSLQRGAAIWTVAANPARYVLRSLRSDAVQRCNRATRRLARFAQARKPRPLGRSPLLVQRHECRLCGTKPVNPIPGCQIVLNGSVCTMLEHPGSACGNRTARFTGDDENGKRRHPESRRPFRGALPREGRGTPRGLAADGAIYRFQFISRQIIFHPRYRTE